MLDGTRVEVGLGDDSAVADELLEQIELLELPAPDGAAAPVGEGAVPAVQAARVPTSTRDSSRPRLSSTLASCADLA